MRVYLLVALLSFNSMMCWADELDKKTEAVYRLFESNDMEKTMNESISLMVDMELQGNPAMAPYKNVLIEFFSNHIGFDAIKTEIAELYVTEFTLEEIEGLIRFNSSELGKKANIILPKLIRSGAEISQAKIQENIHVLQDMIAAESTRIQTLQGE